LLPTFRQIQARHPDAVMMWFASGRLWRSEEEFRDARFKRRERDGGRDERDRPRDPRAPRPPAFARKPSRPGYGGDAPPTRRDPGDWRDRPRGPKPDWTGKSRDREVPRASPPKDRWRDRPVPPAGGDEKRGRDWRPGGQHKDPRDRFKVPRDVKRARFKQKAWRDRTNPKRGQPPVAPKPRSGEGGKPRSEGGKPRGGEGGPKKKGEE